MQSITAQELGKIYGEIEHGKMDREEMIRVLRDIIKKINELYEWHDARDEDGALKWWNKGSIERTIKVLKVQQDRLEAKLDSVLKKSGRSGQYSLVHKGRKDEDVQD